MKTLSNEVQCVILSEAGSTYRNFLLSLMREYKVGEDSFEMAAQATQQFIDMAVKNAVGN